MDDYELVVLVSPYRSSLLVVLMPADDSGIRRVGSTRFLSESIFVMISIIIIIVVIVSIPIMLDQVHQGL